MKDLHKNPFFWMTLVMLLAILIWPGWLWGHPIWDTSKAANVERHLISTTPPPIVVQVILPTQVVPTTDVQPTATLIEYTQRSQQPALPTSAPGYCEGIPVNPQDGVKVTLKRGWYVVEKYNNRGNPPVHHFEVITVNDNEEIKVLATPYEGQRAWKCTDETSARDTAITSAMGYKLQHPDHKVYGPEGEEVR